MSTHPVGFWKSYHLPMLVMLELCWAEWSFLLFAELFCEGDFFQMKALCKYAVKRFEEKAQIFDHTRDPTEAWEDFRAATLHTLHSCTRRRDSMHEMVASISAKKLSVLCKTADFFGFLNEHAPHLGVGILSKLHSNRMQGDPKDLSCLCCGSSLDEADVGFFCSRMIQQCEECYAHCKKETCWVPAEHPALE